MKMTLNICRVLFLIVIFTLIGTYSSHAMENQTPGRILIEYHDALKNGDIQKMLSYLGGDFYKRYVDLLTRDPGYPDFVKNYYKGSTINIQNTMVNKSDAVVEVQIRFPNGNKSINKFHLEKSNDGVWLITGQYLD
jgi:hypothetical protein